MKKTKQTGINKYFYFPSDQANEHQMQVDLMDTFPKVDIVYVPC